MSGIYHFRIPQAATDDLTEVTQISDLADSPSLLEILTAHTHNITSPPPPPQRVTTPPPHSSNGECRAETMDHCLGNHTGQRATCVRRLELTRAPANTSITVADEVESAEQVVLAEQNQQSVDDDTVEVNDETPSSKVDDHIRESGLHSSTSSLLALELQRDSDHSSTEDELFTTALQEASPPTTPTHHTPSTPHSATPFLADSLRKIEQRRRARQTSQATPLFPLNTTTRTGKPSSGQHAQYHTVSDNAQTRQSTERLTLTSAVSTHHHRHHTSSSTISPSKVAHRTAPTVSNSSSTNIVKPSRPEPKLPSATTTTPAQLHSHDPSLVADSSFVADIKTRVPPHLHRLTNQELRQSLVGRGEQPGPVTDLTRSAYLLYLAKLEAGIQPAGNSGYKGWICMYIYTTYIEESITLYNTNLV